MRYFERQRIEFISLQLQNVGHIRRADLIEKFQISMPQASNDFTKYKRFCKKWLMLPMKYNTVSKRYERKQQ